MKVDVQIEGLEHVRSMLQGFSARRMASVGATALTRVARGLANQWRQQLERRLDRPTSSTLRAVQWGNANASTLMAEVKIRSDGPSATAPTQWLRPQEFGGARRTKLFERALQSQGALPAGWQTVPGPAARLDGYGNVSRGQIVQVIAQLGARYSPGYQRVISKSAAKRAATAQARGRAYVAILPGARGGLAPGVYERAGRGVRAVFWYVSRTQYRKAIDLLGEAQRTVPGALQRELQRAIEESARRLADRRAR